MGVSGTNTVSLARRLPQAGCGYSPADQSHLDSMAAPPHQGTALNIMRPVYCVLGVPIDAVSMTIVLRKVDAAAAGRIPFLLSTPNLNFLVSSLSDTEFRESLLDSNLCPPDGVPIVWIARLLGLPIKERVTGADLLDVLRDRPSAVTQLSLFLFGGAKGVADAAARSLNACSNGLICVGTMDPGFCAVDEMSSDHIIDTLNSSGADFLVLALGAKKGQSWLQRNHSRLKVPIRAHLGAAINFQAGSIRRAPLLFRRCGLEWLWRIKEERYLWRRYRDDAAVLIRLFLTRILPLAVITRWQRLLQPYRTEDLQMETNYDDRSIAICLSGVASKNTVPNAISRFQQALEYKKDILVDFSRVTLIDARFLGLLIMLRKDLKDLDAKLILTGVSRSMEKIFRLNEASYLIATGRD